MQDPTSVRLSDAGLEARQACTIEIARLAKADQCLKRSSLKTESGAEVEGGSCVTHTGNPHHTSPHTPRGS